MCWMQNVVLLRFGPGSQFLAYYSYKDRQICKRLKVIPQKTGHYCQMVAENLEFTGIYFL